MSVARRMAHWLGLLAVSGFAFMATVNAQTPQVNLGTKASIGLGQPRVTVTLFDDGRSLGPRTNGVFLLDTGANSVLAFTRATKELSTAGYETVGTFTEQGVSGNQVFDVSAPYDLSFQGAAGGAIIVPDVQLLSSKTVEVDTLGLLQINGIVGMPGMVNRVTTLDIARGPTDFFGFVMHTAFSSTLPAGQGHRYSVELSPLEFPPAGAGPHPTAVPLPAFDATLANGCLGRTTNFILDTGAQSSIISPRVAFDLGLDKNGNGSLTDEQIGSLPIGGIGGTVNAPQLIVPELRLLTDQGVELVWQNLVVMVQDIDPRIEAVFGADFLSGGSILDPTPGVMQRVHFDFREFPAAAGQLVMDLVPSANRTTTPAVPILLGDTNFDAKIDASDLQLLAEYWQHEVVRGPVCGDLNSDHFVDINDLVTLASVWERSGNGVPPLDLQAWMSELATVPEPTFAAWWVFCFVFGGRGRRRNLGARMALSACQQRGAE